MARRKKYEKKSFESTGSTSDVSANIYISMFMSPAWMELSSNQKTLYVYCKAQYYAEKRKPDNCAIRFTMNRAKWMDLYKLYTNANSAGFYRDISALIEKGFIICVSSGANTRTKSIYEFSAMWQNYGTEKFEVHVQSMTQGMRRRVTKSD